MHWLHPYALWALLAVAAVVMALAWSARQRRRAMQAFGFDRARMAEVVHSGRRKWKHALLVAGVLLLVLAIAGPRMGTRLKEYKREGLDLVVALDVSASMLAEDTRPNRLERARNELRKLLGTLQGDRVGLVLFAGDAFIQCPLTTDYGAARLFLDTADPSLIPTPGTDFDQAMDVAIRLFERSKPAAQTRVTRVLLVVSDGENHISETPTILAKARKAGIAVFAVGVGETTGAPIPIYDGGRLIGYRQDRDGRTVSTKLEEPSLRELAADGAYFRISGTSSSLGKLPAALDRLEQTEFEVEQFEEYQEQYQWPLALAIFLLLVEVALPDRRRLAT